MKPGDIVRVVQLVGDRDKMGDTLHETGVIYNIGGSDYDYPVKVTLDKASLGMRWFKEEELELYNPQLEEPEFKVGDEVKVVKMLGEEDDKYNNKRYMGLTGTIREIDPTCEYHVWVEFGDEMIGFLADELEHVSEPESPQEPVEEPTEDSEGEFKYRTSGSYLVEIHYGEGISQFRVQCLEFRAVHALLDILNDTHVAFSVNVIGV